MIVGNYDVLFDEIFLEWYLDCCYGEMMRIKVDLNWGSVIYFEDLMMIIILFIRVVLYEFEGVIKGIERRVMVYGSFYILVYILLVF